MKNREQKIIYYLMALALSLFALFGCAIIEGPPHFSEKVVLVGLLVYIVVGALYGIALRMGKVKRPFLLSYAAGSCLLAPVFLEGYTDLVVVIIYIAALFALPGLFVFAEKGFRNRVKDARIDFASHEFRSDGEYPLVIADRYMQGYVCQIIKCDDLILTYYIGHEPKGYDYKLIQLGDKALRPLSKRDRCFYLKDVDSIIIYDSPRRLGRDFAVDVTVGNSIVCYAPSLFWPDREGSGDTLKMFWEDMKERLEAMKAGPEEKSRSFE